VAVSGGLDSSVLLHVLSTLARSSGWRLVVAHYNHGLRGRQSDRDQRSVESMAAVLGLPCVSEKASGPLPRERGESLEMSARNARHEFLARAARQRDLRRIALAHHADDQVEQFFLRLLRGAGGRSLAGMRWEGPSPADPSVALVRPLLSHAKADLAAYAERYGISYREDASNRSRNPLRNRIRLDLIPRLKRHYQKGLAQVVSQTMEVLAEEAAFLEQHALACRRGGQAFDSLPPAIQRLVLHQALLEVRAEPSYRVIEELRHQAWRHVDTGGGGWCARDLAGAITTGMAATQPVPGEHPREVVVSLEPSHGIQEFSGVTIHWTRLERRRIQLPSLGSSVEYFDEAAVGSPIRLRHWRAGDRFQPIGMKSPVKLQDLFVNAKVPKAERQARVLAEASDGRIFWVEGLRIGEHFKLDNTTRRQLKWEWRRAAGVPGPFARSGSRC
jgi:tRNA(Ile)-lysidine synthase